MTDAVPPTADASWRALVPTLAALLLLAVVALAVGTASCAATDGRLTYAQDDAYIHMAMAKTDAIHGVWGISAARFTASSSSPLWTALLALSFRLAGIHDLIPLVLNLIFAIASVILVGSELRHQQLPPRLSTALLVAFVGAVPLVPLAWVGMEATLQVFLSLWCAQRCLRWLDAPSTPRDVTILFVGAMLLAAVRYEGLFVLAGCAVALAMNGHWRLAAALPAAGLLPVTAVGLWNWSHGWFFLPASIVMKRSLFLSPGDAGFASDLAESLRTLRMPVAVAILGLTVAGALLVLSAFRERRRTVTGGLVIFLVAFALHVATGRFGTFYRYEAYLVALGLFVLIPVVHHLARFLGGREATGAWRGQAVLASTAVAACALFAYGLNGALYTPAATGNIYQQQRQMARFIAAYYDGQMIAMNDIGAAAYYTNAQVLDLSGLASLEVARTRLQSGPQPFQRLADAVGSADVAIVYESWFPASREAGSPWRRAARWTIPRNVVCGDATVSFFGRGVTAVHELQQHLREFESRLPDGVMVEHEPEL